MIGGPTDENEAPKRVARRLGTEPREDIMRFGHPGVQRVSSRTGFAQVDS